MKVRTIIHNIMRNEYDWGFLTWVSQIQTKTIPLVESEYRNPKGPIVCEFLGTLFLF